MRFKLTIKNEIKVVAALSILFLVVAFSGQRQGTVLVKDITIKVENIHDNHFLDEADVADLMQLQFENLKGANLGRLNLKEIEKRIKADRFVKDAELYSDLKGNLIVRTTLRRPVARIVRNDGPDGYIAEDGTVMPVSEKFTSRVVLISGSYVKELLTWQNLNEHEEGLQLLHMLAMIREDDFWRAQIAQLDIDSKGRINMFPQIGGQTIEFGRAENIGEKMKKLKIFYKEIFPEMGWNAYRRINLEYEGQIVAE
jgi:cell division protein FtsQ